jgi:hypothetical protein
MKTRILLLIFLLPILFMFCEKESFPNYEDLIGEWDEITSYLDRQVLIFDDQDTLYYGNQFSRGIHTDTLLFRLDKKHEMLYLRPAAYPDSTESAHKIILDSKNNELTIWGLPISIPESSSVTKFRKQ